MNKGAKQTRLNNNSVTTANKDPKVCNNCGHVGKHPRGSNCPSIRRKQTKKNPNTEEDNNLDYDNDY